MLIFEILVKKVIQHSQKMLENMLLHQISPFITKNVKMFKKKQKNANFKFLARKSSILGKSCGKMSFPLICQILVRKSFKIGRKCGKISHYT